MRMLGMLLTCKFSDALKEIESRERLFCCESDELPQLLELKNVFISRNSIWCLTCMDFQLYKYFLLAGQIFGSAPPLVVRVWQVYFDLMLSRNAKNYNTSHA